MVAFFGETPPGGKTKSPPPSPYKSTTTTRGDEPSTTLSPTARAGTGNMGAKKMNRASTVSIMSGLGVPLGSRTSSDSNPRMMDSRGNMSPDLASSSPSARSPSAGSFLAKANRIHNFFGHRPPSELISSHLPDFFPKMGKKQMEAARNSMLRVSSDGQNGHLVVEPGMRSLPRTSWADESSPSLASSDRMSTMSIGSGSRKKRASSGARSIKGKQHRTSVSPTRGAILEDANEGSSAPGSETSSLAEGVPRVSISTDDGIIELSESESDADSIASRPPLLPPFVSSGDTFSADSLAVFSPGSNPQQRDGGDRSSWAANNKLDRRASVASSRMSMMSKHRRSRDKSDTASLRTLDEITAHVQSKRASMVSFAMTDGGSASSSADHGSELDDQALTPAPYGRRGSTASRASRASRASTIAGAVVGSEEGEEEVEDEDEEEYDEDEDEEDYYSSEEDESDEDDDDDEDDDEEDEVEENEQGKAFMSAGGEPTPSLPFPSCIIQR